MVECWHQQGLCPKKWWVLFSSHIVHDRVHVWSAQAVQHEPCRRNGLVSHILPKTALSRFLPGLESLFDQDIIVCLWNLFNYIYHKTFRWRWPHKQIVHKCHSSRPQVLPSRHIELKCVQYFCWPKTKTGGDLGEIFQKRPTECGTDWITLSTRPGTLQGRYNTALCHLMTPPNTNRIDGWDMKKLDQY